MKPAILDDRRELDAYLRNDFVAFTEKVFHHLNPGRDFTAGWYIRAMAYMAMSVTLRAQHNRLLVNLPPRALKSTMFSVALPAFLLGHDPRKRINVASYSQELSNMFGRQTRAVMQSDWYRRIFPSTRLDRHRQAEHDFHTTRRGFRFATSIQGTFTGRGGDMIIVDDPLKADDVYSDVKRNAAIEWTKTTLFNRLDIKRDGVIINVQQRLHEDDLSGHLMRAGGWWPLNLPAIAEKDEWIPMGLGRERYFRRAGEPLDPSREPIEVLDQVRREVGTAMFSAQYQQVPTPADGDVIKMSWFRRYEEAPAGGEVIMSVDTAYKPGEHNDYSACSIWRVIENRFYLLHVWRRQVDYPSLKRMIAAMAETHRPNIILIEDKVSGQSLIQELKEGGGAFRVVAYEPKSDKETRMRVQAAKIENQQVYLPRDADWLANFENEVRQFPNGKNDDQVDSMSQLLDYKSQPVASLFVIPYRT